MVKKDKCNSCEVCIKKCPIGNISMSKKDFPKWGRNCISCWYCEMACPMDAITSWIDWPIIDLFTRYNVAKTLSDPTINNVKVSLSKGKVVRL